MRRFKHRGVELDEIRMAAVGVAFEQGLHAVTFETIAERLQVPLRSVLADRPDRATVVADAFSRIVSAELAEVKRVVLAHPSPVKQMTALLETLAEPSRAEVDAVWVESWSLGRRNPALGAAVREEEGAWHVFVASVIRRGVRSGDFLAVDPDEVAAQLLAMIDGVNAYALVGYRSDLDRLRLLTTIARAELGVSFDGSVAPAVR